MNVALCTAGLQQDRWPIEFILDVSFDQPLRLDLICAPFLRLRAIPMLLRLPVMHHFMQKNADVVERVG